MTANKAVVNLVVATIGALTVALGTGNNSSIGNLSTTTWLVAIGSILGSTGVVWFCQNGPWHQYIKAVVAAGSAGIASLVVALNDHHISQAEGLVALSAAIVAGAAVFQVTNKGKAA
jgi:hypothetical protein